MGRTIVDVVLCAGIAVIFGVVMLSYMNGSLNTGMQRGMERMASEAAE